MKRALSLSATLLFCLAATPAVAPAASPLTLDAVYARIDKAAAGFRGIGGDIKRVTHTAVIKDTSEETGSFKLKRSGKDMRLLIDFTNPAPRSVSFEGKTARIYYPKINTVQEYDLGKQKNLVDQFLLLGFGTSSKDLRSRYNVKLAGDDTISGKTVAHLELVPKAAEVSEHIKKVELWIDMETGNPLRQKFHQGGGDYLLVEYAGLSPSSTLSDSDVGLKLPKNVKVERPKK